MNFDINATIAQMVDAVKGVLKNDWNNIQDSATGFFNDHKQRLETLATQRVNGEIDDDFLKARLEDEKDILTAEIDAVKIVAKSMAQQAANAAMDVLQKAVASAIKI
jgi:hypothetical protein